MPERTIIAHVPLLLAAACALVAGTALIGGWILGAEVLLRVLPGFPAMAPTTALSFCLLSIALALGWSCDEGYKARLAYTLVFVTVLIVLVTLLGYLLPGRVALDELLVGPRPEQDHMAVATGIGLLMASYCVLAVMAPDNPDPEAPAYFAIAGISTAAAVICGHLFDAATFFTLEAFQGVSMNSAVALILLFSAVLGYPADRVGAEFYNTRES